MVPDRPAPAAVTIRDAAPGDWAAIWPFFSAIVAARETYAYDPELTSEAGRAIWFPPPPGRTSVAVDGHGRVLGSASMYPNRPGPGAHVASASFMVDPAGAGRGVGRALGEEMIAWARASGFRAIQFNAVVETNQRAVRLWQSLGFRIIGTVPEAYAHATRGHVGLHVMHRFL